MACKEKNEGEEKTGKEGIHRCTQMNADCSLYPVSCLLSPVPYTPEIPPYILLQKFKA